MLPEAPGLSGPPSCLNQARVGLIFARADPAAQFSLGKLSSVREAIAIARECRAILAAAGITNEYLDRME